MRVITGLYKGKRLSVPKGYEIRPTIERLRESYFNIIQMVISGSCFLDLCAGTGSMGIEALSRGARKVTFVEKRHSAVSTIKKNLKICGIKHNFEIIEEDIFKQIPRFALSEEQFDLIYLDPPYFKNIYNKTLNLVNDVPILKRGGILATNHFKKIVLPDRVKHLVRYRMVRHGDSILSFYEWIN